MSNPSDLRHKTIAWLVQSAGELQKQIRELEATNAALRSENTRLRRELSHMMAMGKVAAKAVGR